MTVPLIRTIVAKHKDAGLPVARQLLRSRIHEERLTALLLLVRQFQDGDEEEQASIFTLYIGNTRYINNWDLVDCSAPAIVGGYLLERDRKILTRLARSKLLWERRIAIIATLHFIKGGVG